MRNRLYRSRHDRMLFGVAGGMADWLDLDPSLVRLVWALLVLAAGVGILLYFVAAVVIPEEPASFATGPASSTDATGATDAMGATSAAPGTADDREARRAARRAARGGRDGSGAMIFGLALVAVGVWFLVSRYLKIDSDVLVPVLLIGLGGALLLGAVGRSGRGGA